MMRSFWSKIKGERGFTLLEMGMSTAIGALITGVLVMALYQFNNLTRVHQNILTLSQQMQSAASMLNHDVVSAASGVVSGETLTLQVPAIIFGSETPITKTITYDFAPAKGTLTRGDGSTAVIIARDLSDVDFGPEGAISSIVMITVTADLRGESETTTLLFKRRPAD